MTAIGASARMASFWSRSPQGTPIFECDITTVTVAKRKCVGTGRDVSPVSSTRSPERSLRCGSKLRPESFEAQMEGELVRLEMSRPHDLVLRRTLEIGGVKLSTHSINTGVPHVVTFVDDIESTPVQQWGAQIRYHAAFQPNGTNANFIKEIEPGRIAIRTYERGVEGETLACGTGVTAAGLIYAALSEVTSPVQLLVRGGDWLEVGFRRAGTGFEDVTLKGPADFVFEGSIEIP